MNPPTIDERPEEQLRADALAIWRAGVEAVASDRLTREAIYVDTNGIEIEDLQWVPQHDSRVCVVGAGKAGAGMALGLEAAFGAEQLARYHVSGWINVPDDCITPTAAIHLHAARTSRVNLPTEAGVQGSREILHEVAKLRSQDLCICLISGGGSALLPAPREGVSLADKQNVTEQLAERGANIIELNTVRKALSCIKGGGLASACNAGTLITLVISDVPGDPIASIASGPTWYTPDQEAQAISVLRKFELADAFPHLMRVLEKSPSKAEPTTKLQLEHRIIGNNALAVDAAGMEAERRGYSHAMTSSRIPEQDVRQLGPHLARLARRMHDEAGPDCLISGGEPTVKLPATGGGEGGRNQQLVLEFWNGMREIAATANRQDSHAAAQSHDYLSGVCMLSGGTDGEDGPTDAAGAFVDRAIAAEAQVRQLDPDPFRQACDAYPFWKQLGSLIVTGPTHTNVCDLRVIVVGRREPQLRTQHHTDQP